MMVVRRYEEFVGKHWKVKMAPSRVPLLHVPKVSCRRYATQHLKVNYTCNRCVQFIEKYFLNLRISSFLVIDRGRPPTRRDPCDRGLDFLVPPHLVSSDGGMAGLLPRLVQAFS